MTDPRLLPSHEVTLTLDSMSPEDRFYVIYLDHEGKQRIIRGVRKDLYYPRRNQCVVDSVLFDYTRVLAVGVSNA